MLYSPLGKTAGRQLETSIHCTDQRHSAWAVGREHARHAWFTALHSEVQTHVCLLGKAAGRRGNRCDKVAGRGGDGSACAHRGCGQGRGAAGGHGVGMRNFSAGQ